jgi:hypothetical protein
LLLLQNRKGLDYSIAQSREESRRAFLRRFKNVASELPVVSRLLNNDKIVDFAELLPDLSELRHHQFSEERADADISEIITFSANHAVAGGIVSVLGMVKRLLHEPGERLRAAVANFVANEFDESGIPSLRAQRPTRLR